MCCPIWMLHPELFLRMRLCPSGRESSHLVFMKCSMAYVGSASFLVSRVQWKAESNTLRFACSFIRKHSQEQHLQKIRKVELGEKEDELWQDCKRDVSWSHRRLWSWVGSLELPSWSKLVRTSCLCITPSLTPSFLSPLISVLHQSSIYEWVCPKRSLLVPWWICLSWHQCHPITPALEVLLSGKAILSLYSSLFVF